MTQEERKLLTEIIHRWLKASDRHANEAKHVTGEEHDLHKEAARLYRRCAEELREALE
jgi:hypothetical protein